MSISTKELHAALKTYFGFGKFKGLQEQVKTRLRLCQQGVVNLFVISSQL
jgi:hypothetical protein